MKTTVTLRPGRKGTLRLCEQFGDRLVCVRYRHDPVGNRRLKTAEIIVDEKPWLHCPRFDWSTPGPIVHVHIGLQERELRARVKEAGGTWNPARLLWTLQAETAQRLGLDLRIIHGSGYYIS